MKDDPLQAWKVIEFFVPSEFDDPDHPGSGILTNIDYVRKMDILRRVSKCRISVHKSVGGGVDLHGTHGHSDESCHLKEQGFCASDWHFGYDPDFPDLSKAVMKNPRLQVQLVMAAGFGGIGVYYDWNSCDVGFHTDGRAFDRYQVWTRIEGNYTYTFK